MVVPKFIDAALNDEPITIHGDGSQSRSFTWVEDVVEYFIKLAEMEAYGEIFNIGQYLQPSKNNLEVDRFVHPDTFKLYEEYGYKLGFKVVESGPLVRSSYHADSQAREFGLNGKV